MTPEELQGDQLGAHTRGYVNAKIARAEMTCRVRRQKAIEIKCIQSLLDRDEY